MFLQHEFICWINIEWLYLSNWYGRWKRVQKYILGPQTQQSSSQIRNTIKIYTSQYEDIKGSWARIGIGPKITVEKLVCRVNWTYVPELRTWEHWVTGMFVTVFTEAWTVLQSTQWVERDRRRNSAKGICRWAKGTGRASKSRRKEGRSTASLRAQCHMPSSGPLASPRWGGFGWGTWEGKPTLRLWCSEQLIVLHSLRQRRVWEKKNLQV
jgi:hypothetical protein